MIRFERLLQFLYKTFHLGIRSSNHEIMYITQEKHLHVLLFITLMPENTRNTCRLLKFQIRIILEKGLLNSGAALIQSKDTLVKRHDFFWSFLPNQVEFSCKVFRKIGLNKSLDHQSSTRIYNSRRLPLSTRESKQL